MSLWLPWLRIALGILTYIVIALGASYFIRKVGEDIKSFKGRSSLLVLAIGMIANLCILFVTILLVRFLDRRSLAALGLSFSNRDAVFSTTAILVICGLALAFILYLNKTGKNQIGIQSPLKGSTGKWGGLAVWATLLVVALQEEVLFRGYLTLNLLNFGPLVIIAVTTLIFAGIHVLTNRVNFYQFSGWLIGGAVLSFAYLITGTLWVPVLLHFATDMINVLFFDIMGEFSLFEINPSLNAEHRIGYRVMYALALVIALLVFFGPSLSIA